MIETLQQIENSLPGWVMCLLGVVLSPLLSVILPIYLSIKAMDLWDEFRAVVMPVIRRQVAKTIGPAKLLAATKVEIDVDRADSGWLAMDREI